MAKFYVATGLSRAKDQNVVRDALVARGHELTYDWSAHGDSPKFESMAVLKDVALAEIEGVLASDVLVVLLPGGGGTHVELGVALSVGKPVIIHSEEPTPFRLGKKTKAFYHHPQVRQVVCSLDALQPLLDAFSQFAGACLC